MRIRNIGRVMGTGPLLTPTKSWPEFGDPERDELIRALNSGEWGIGSPEIEAQEKAFRRLMGLSDSYASVTTTNGTHALQLILEGLNIGAGDRVIVPGETHVATASSVIDVNAIPVILDVCETWTLDPDLVEAWLAGTQGTNEMPQAVIAVHLYNRAADVKRLFEICKRFGVWLVEDNTHCQRATIGGRPAMGWGVASSTSRESSLPRNTGEGGDIVTCDPVLERRLRALVNCGRPADATIREDAAADEVVAYWRARVETAGLLPAPIQSGDYRGTGFTDALARAQNRRFLAYHALHQAALRALDEVMPTVPGISWYVQPPWVASPACYRLAFEFDPDAYAGMDNDTFREALWFLLGSHHKVGRTYEPLNDAQLYNPLSKQRHRINPEYMAAIDPGQWALPRCKRIHERGVTIDHSAAREPEIARVLPLALRLMQERAERIVAAAS